MILEVSNLVKRYNDKIALDHLNLKVSEGEIYGLLGPNGAGKSTTINCIQSLLNFDKGVIKIFGKEMSPTSYDIKSKIGVVGQNVAVFDELTVFENIDFFASLYIYDKKKRLDLVNEAIEFVQLNEFVKYVPKKLSGGLLRRLNIACGIVHKPKLIFLDEPTVAVDPQSRNNILDGILRLNKEGSTIIYTSHYMEEVEQICTRIGIVDSGRIIAEGTKEELKNMISDTDTLILEIFGVNEKILKEIKTIESIKNIVYDESTLKITYGKGNDNILIKILTCIQKQGLTINKIYNAVPTLNEVFLELTGKKLRDV